MKEYRINDKWILDRVSSQSTSFSQWIENIMKTVEQSLKEVNPEQLEEIKKDKKFSSLKDIDKELANAKREIAKMGNVGGLRNKMGSNISNWVMKTIDRELEESRSELEDLDFDIGMITGKRKNLSSALYDVSKDRGIESKGLLYLIKALPDLEAFLYSTSVRKYYRDHTEHALRVAVLGDFLLEQDLGHGTLSGVISDLTGLDKNLLKDKYWWVTGLIHDIGYPLGKMTTAVNFSLVNQLLKCYPTLDLEFLPFEISLSWKGNQEEYLNIIEDGLSKNARALIREGVGFNKYNKISQKPHVYLRTEDGHPEFNYQSILNLDHGVISALSLLNGLGTPDEIKNNDEYEGYIITAKAIALHNFKAQLKEYTFDSHPLAFFLMLIDELQEWGRPIPIQVRDTYFTTEIKKVTLLDDILLNLDEFSWLMQFKNNRAKNLMEFDFNSFSKEKEKSFGRLDRGESFSKTTINLQDLKIGKSKDRKGEILNQSTIVI
ncbi:MAG: hypothetical protein HWN79_12600 [Candidatus Lokiarchaeota archaeon]|nr:hypothetical protein [Candidatus Lokiarchaeota archaeon]